MHNLQPPPAEKKTRPGSSRSAICGVLAAEKLGVFERMSANIDKWELFDGVWMSLPVIYLLCGLVSDARWLQPKWGRRFVVPLSRLSRLPWIAGFGLFAAESFVRAFHCDVHFPPGLVFPIFLVIFILMILSNIRDHRLYKSKHDPDA